MRPTLGLRGWQRRRQLYVRRLPVELATISDLQRTFGLQGRNRREGLRYLNERSFVFAFLCPSDKAKICFISGMCNDQFYCSRSGKCIPTAKKCDAQYDCYLKEDETDCRTYLDFEHCFEQCDVDHQRYIFVLPVALTDGEYMDLDSDNRSVLHTEGLFSRYYEGEWRVQCLEQEIMRNDTMRLAVARNLCVYLGFAYVRISSLFIS